MPSSKRSTQRQRDFELLRTKREELEKQHEAKLRIARQRLEFEKQTKLRELEIEQLEEDHRTEVAAAALEEIELMTKASADWQNERALYGKKFSREQESCSRLGQFVTGREHGRCCKRTEFALFWFHRPIQPSNCVTCFFNSTSKLTL